MREPTPWPARVIRVRATDYLFATAVTLVAFALAFAADRYVSAANLSLILLTAVLAVAVRKPMAVAVYTAVLCFLGDNFFFTRLSGQVVSLRAAHARARALLELGQRLAEATDAASIRQAATLSLRQVMDAPLEIRPATPDAPADATAMTQRRDGPDEAEAWFIPLVVGTHRHGDVVFPPAAAARLDQDRRELAQTMAQDIALALERARLAGELEQARLQGETERLRNALLSSVSHDLRSPLASMIGAADTLVVYETQLPRDERQELLQAILHEGRRLDRYIQNLLDMTRLGHGTLKLHRDWVDATEVVVAATDRLRRFFPELNLQTVLPGGTVLLYVHPALIEQALFNVLENAAHFSPPGAAVRVVVSVAGDQLRLAVIDHGPGIPPEQRARVFDMFYSVARGDRGDQGTGLGLSICRGMIGAHGGTVEALPAAGAGTTIRITLPLPPAPETNA